MSCRLRWETFQLQGKNLTADGVSRGDHVLIVADNVSQYELLNLLFPKLEDRQFRSPFFLEDGEIRYEVGSDEFVRRVGSIIQHRGLVANLSLKENLLLPFLYHGDTEALAHAEERIERVASFLGLNELDRQAGARSSYTHALASLARCMLQEPEVIVVREVLVGMSPEQLRQFIRKAIKALGLIDAGILYLSGSEKEGSGINFARKHVMIESRIQEEVAG